MSGRYGLKASGTEHAQSSSSSPVAARRMQGGSTIGIMLQQTPRKAGNRTAPMLIALGDESLSTLVHHSVSEV